MNGKKIFVEPVLVVMGFTVDDIIATSKDQDWGGGNVDICSIQDL